MVTNKKIGDQKELINSIKVKSELVGLSDEIEKIIIKEDFNAKRYEKLILIENIMKRRVSKYRKIIAFFKPLREDYKEILKEKSDEEFSIACKIIEKCEQSAKFYEEQTGVEVKNKKVYLTNKDIDFFYELFSPTEMIEVTKDSENQNVDEKEEFLTREEIIDCWGEDTTLSEVNKTLKVNIHYTT